MDNISDFPKESCAKNLLEEKVNNAPGFFAFANLA